MRFTRRGLGDLGDRGEEAAEGFLRRRGYVIVERNFRCPLGEIDLIALERGTIVFVEVKTRRTHGFGSPAEAVDRRKQQRLRRAAEVYLNRKRLHDRHARFDVVEVYWEDTVPRCELIANAFDVPP